VSSVYSVTDNRKVFLYPVGDVFYLGHLSVIVIAPLKGGCDNDNR
jgi:hypothetical protein